MPDDAIGLWQYDGGLPQWITSEADLAWLRSGVDLDKSKLNIAVTWGQACNDLEAEYHREQDLLESKLN